MFLRVNHSAGTITYNMKPSANGPSSRASYEQRISKEFIPMDNEEIAFSISIEAGQRKLTDDITKSESKTLVSHWKENRHSKYGMNQWPWKRIESKTEHEWEMNSRTGERGTKTSSYRHHDDGRIYFFFISCVSARNIAAVILAGCCCCPPAVESDIGRDVMLGLGDGEPDCPFITGLENGEIASPSREAVERRTRFDSGLWKRGKRE